MGKFTALKDEVYPRTPFTAFPATAAFAMESATALAWAAQLAYETADKGDRILTRWGWRRDAMLDGVFSEALPFTIASGFVAHAGQTTIVAFAGTEPDNPLEWIRNFSVRPIDGMHKGFKAGVDALWEGKRLPELIDAASEIYFCGHSLGGALAVAAADRLCRDTPEAAVKIRGVYTMGMPRVGTEQFARTYNDAPVGPNSSLGQRTFRLVHGKDIARHLPPTIPPFGYRHVGRVLSCPHGGSFAADDPGPATIEGPNADGEVALDLASVLLPDESAPPFPAENDVAADLAATLSPIFRGHLMDRYLRALGAM
jgi:hypothetical protein